MTILHGAPECVICGTPVKTWPNAVEVGDGRLAHYRCAWDRPEVVAALTAPEGDPDPEETDRARPR